MGQFIMRRTMLFIPGNKPDMHKKAGNTGADAVIFDLEDSVNSEEKEKARLIVTDTLRNLSLQNTEVVVRINPLNTEFGIKDIYEIARMRPHALMIPKATEDSLKSADKALSEIESREGLTAGSIKLFPIIETAFGVENMHSIIKAASRVTGVLFGAEDFTADMGIARTDEGDEIFYARSRIAVCCRAFKIDAIDTPYVNIKNDEGLIKDTRRARQAGMTGKAAIHPAQVEKIHKEFAPTEEEIRYAEKVLEAQALMKKAGGVLQLDGRMIDAPIIERAAKVMRMAKLSGIR